MAQRSLDLFLTPKHAALFGVSRDPASITARPAAYASTLGSRPRITIVRSGGADEMHGTPVVPSLAALDETPDVAMVMVPADAVLPLLRDCVEAGVKGAVVISSGFEDGAGAPRRAALAEFLVAHPGFRLIGPNCVGVTSPAADCWLSFSSVLRRGRPLAGSIGLVTQSGAVGNGLFLALQERGAGLAHWVSTGNELDVGALEAATDLLRRPECEAVGMFLEGITDPEHRADLAAAIEETGKPVVAVRAAASEQGKRAAMGHTGRVIGRDEVARAALLEIGVELVDTLDELTAALTVASVAPRRRDGSSPASVAVVTVSGATGVMAADEVALRPNLRMAVLDGGAAGEGPANPLDVPVLGEPQVFERAITEVVRSGAADATVAVVSTLAHDYESISRSQSAGDGPLVLAHLSPAEQFTPEQARRLASRGVAVVRTPREAVRALSIWAGRSATAPLAHRTTTAGPGIPTGPVQYGMTRSVRALGGVIDRWLVPARIVHGTEDALEFARAQAGTGIVLKADGDRIAHRADVGAVAVGARTDSEIAAAHDAVAAVCARHGDAVLAQAMAPAGLEVMVSVLRDPEVGVVAMLRLGGSFAELGTGSVVLTERRSGWARAVETSALGAVLAGWRGGAALSADALYALLDDLVTAVAERSAIELVECNPVIVHPRGVPRGVTVVDLLSYTASEGAISL